MTARLTMGTYQIVIREKSYWRRDCFNAYRIGHYVSKQANTYQLHIEIFRFGIHVYHTFDFFSIFYFFILLLFHNFFPFCWLHLCVISQRWQKAKAPTRTKTTKEKKQKWMREKKRFCSNFSNNGLLTGATVTLVMLGIQHPMQPSASENTQCRCLYNDKMHRLLSNWYWLSCAPRRDFVGLDARQRAWPGPLQSHKANPIIIVCWFRIQHWSLGRIDRSVGRSVRAP